MKRNFLIAIMLLSTSVSFAQMEDDFESNQYYWNETSSKRGVALIKDGVLHMESKGEPLLCTTYAPFDVNKPFVLTCEALAKKVTDDKIFGIVLDYEDEQNYMRFYICEEEARLEVIKEGIVKGARYERINLQSGKKVGITFEVEYGLNELIFKVNNARALAYRKRVVGDEFLLGTSGIGFFAKDGMVIDFDNLKVMQ